MYSFFKPMMKVVSVILCISLVLGCLSAFAEGKDPNKVTDNAPPEMSAFSFAENGQTLKAGDKIHVSVKAEDRSYIRYVKVNFGGYETDDAGEANFTITLKYNPVNDAYEGETTIAANMANGAWYISNVQAVDEYENVYNFGGTDYGFFTITGNTKAGSIFSSVILQEDGAALKPGDVAHVTVKLTAKVEYVDFAFSCINENGEENGTSYWGGCSYNEETGLWEGEFYFDAYRANGTYYLQQVEYLLDSNWYSFYQEEIGYHYVTFTGGVSDCTPPTIVNYTFAENTATLAPGQTLHVSATVTDDIGVDYVYLYFEGPSSSSMDGKKWNWDEYRKNHYSSQVGGTVYMDLNDQGGGIWAGEYTLPEDMANATYTLTWISASDHAGNYDAAEPTGYYFNFQGPDIVNTNIGNFVKRCYNTILGRGVDETGLHDWGILLATGEKTGAEIINSLTESDEFKQKGLSNGEIVDRMYLAMLGREADAAGKAAWVSVLDEGYPVSAVVNGFSGSNEFRGICKSYGIKPGSVNPGEPTKPVTPTGDTGKIKAFVTRCYSVILGRDPDPDGLNAWADALATGVRKASEIIDGFVNSQEYLSKNLSHEASVKVLYQAMLGRDPDPAGLAAWVKVLDDGNPFGAVINGFCGSTEFINLCAEYGIQPGSVQVKAAFVKRVSITPEGSDAEGSAAYIAYSSEFVNQEKIRAFIMHCYETVLGREGDEEGIANYTALIMGGKKTPKRVAYEFIFSPEFQGRQPGNEELIQVLYKVYLYREADPEGLAAWVAQLDAGVGLEEIVKGFAESAEFKAIVREMKE